MSRTKQKLPDSPVHPGDAERALARLREIYDATDVEIMMFSMREGLKAFQDYEDKVDGMDLLYPMGCRVRARVVRDDWVRNRKLSPAERERIMWAE